MRWQASPLPLRLAFGALAFGICCMSTAARATGLRSDFQCSSGLDVIAQSNLLAGRTYKHAVGVGAGLVLTGDTRVSFTVGLNHASFLSGNQPIRRDPVTNEAIRLGIAEKDTWTIGPGLEIRLFDLREHRVKFYVDAGVSYSYTKAHETGQVNLERNELLVPRARISDSFVLLLGTTLSFRLSDRARVLTQWSYNAGDRRSSSRDYGNLERGADSMHSFRLGLRMSMMP